MPVFDIRCPVIVLTGGISSGKTLFAQTTAPRETCAYDLELSSASYNLPLKEKVTVSDEMRKVFPDGVYKPIDLWKWFHNDIKRRVTPGKFKVCVIDPVSELEAGLTDWVRENPTYFHRTAKIYSDMSSLMLSDVKNYYKQWLLGIAACVEVLFIIVHMTNIWDGPRRTDKMKPMGKDTLRYIASLFLEMKREPTAGDLKPTVPSARVIKERLNHLVEAEDGTWEVRPILPPTLDVATPAALRAFMQKPADYKHLPKSQLAILDTVTDDDRAEVRLLTAQAEEAAAAHRLALAAEAREVRARYEQQAAHAVQLASQPRTEILQGEPSPSLISPLTVPAERLPPPAISEQQLADLASMQARYASASVNFQEALAACGVTDIASLDGEAAADLLAALGSLLHTSVTPTPWLATLQALKKQAISQGSLTEASWLRVLGKRQVTAIEQLTADQANELINSMQTKLNGGAAPAASKS